MREVIKCDDKLFEAAHWCIFAAWTGKYDKYNPSNEAFRMIRALLSVEPYLIW